MPRILFCTQTAYPVGGVETWLDGLVATLAARDWEPIVGLASAPLFHRLEIYRRHHSEFETIEIEDQSGTREGRVAALVKALRRSRPDIVVPVNLCDVLEAVARWKTQGHECRLVAALHGLQAGTVLDLGRYRGFVDAAVTPNRLLLELLVDQAHIERGRCHHVGGGCPPCTRSWVPRKPGEPVRLGYVGRLNDEEKRSDDLLGFVEQLERLGCRYTLSIAGQGSGEAELRSRLEKHVNTDRVRFLGWRTREELYEDVYPQLDCLLVFSASEAGPLALWESMLHGVVAVSSRYRGAAAEGTLVHRETALMFDVGDVAAAAAGVAELVRDEGLFADLSRRGRQVVTGRYSLEAQWRGWMRAFEGSLEGQQAVSQLPPAVFSASGRLERLGLPPWAARRVRGLLGRRLRARGPGDEWPHCTVWPGEALDAVAEAVARLDQAP